MAPAVVLPPKHIPTWKKLGLKLKYAKDVDGGGDTQEAYSSPQQPAEGPIRKRKSSENGIINGLHPPAEPAAKRVKADHANEPLQNGANGTHTSHGKKRISSLSSSREPGTPRSKSKSVSFTPETKEEDGDSVRAIHKKWIAIQKAKDSNFDASKLNPALQAVDAQQLTTNPYKRGDEQALNHASPPTPNPPKALSPFTQPNQANTKTPETEEKGQETQTSNLHSTHPFTTYTLPSHLPHHTPHTSPSTWKFSKSHQNHILKHLFSPDHNNNNDDNHIPPSYDPLLLPYLSGLKGFDARQRIREQALQVRQDDESWLSELDAESPPPPPSSTEPKTTDDQSNGSTPAQDSENSPSTSNHASSTMNPSESGGSGEGGQRGEPGRSLRRRADYEAAVSRLRAMLRQHQTEREEREWSMPGGGSDQWDLRLRKRRRAEVVLWGVGEVAEQRREVKPAPPPPPVVRQVNGFAGMGMMNGANGRGTIGGTPLGRDEGKMRGTIPAMAGNVGKKIVFGGIGSGGGEARVNGSATAAASSGAESSMSEERRRRMNGMDSTGSGVRQINGGEPMMTTTTTIKKKPKQRRKLRAGVRSGVPDDDDSSSSSSSDSDDGDGDAHTTVRKPRQEKPVQRQVIRPAATSMKEEVRRVQSLLSSSSESESDDEDSDSGGSGTGSESVSGSGSGSDFGSGSDSGSGSGSGSSEGSGVESD